MSAGKTILMIEDNPDILWLNQRAFVSAGYIVKTAESLEEARSCMNKCLPDVIVLDILLPDGNGLDIIPEIRAKTGAPILMLTSLVDRDDRLAGLRAGGDDYITKPYDIDELVERVAAFLRREEMHRATPAREIVRGPLKLDVVANRAMLYGEDIGLKPKEFAVLLVLVRNENRDVTAAELYETAWNMRAASDTRTLWPHISKLRRKLSVANDGLFSIESVYGTGYRFVYHG